MTDAEHQYQIGDAVLANLNGAQIPGVVEAQQEGKLLIRLAEPWTDETGQQSDEAWLMPDQLSPSLDDGETAALPG